jgi:DNA-binding beta-propeller fold protein YncE
MIDTETLEFVGVQTFRRLQTNPAPPPEPSVGRVASADGRLTFERNFGGGVLDVLDSAGAQLASVALEHYPLFVALAADESRLYVANNDGTVSVLSLQGVAFRQPPS